MGARPCAVRPPQRHVYRLPATRGVRRPSAPGAPCVPLRGKEQEYLPLWLRPHRLPNGFECLGLFLQGKDEVAGVMAPAEEKVEGFGNLSLGKQRRGGLPSPRPRHRLRPACGPQPFKPSSTLPSITPLLLHFLFFSPLSTRRPTPARPVGEEAPGSRGGPPVSVVARSGRSKGRSDSAPTGQGRAYEGEGGRFHLADFCLNL